MPDKKKSVKEFAKIINRKVFSKIDWGRIEEADYQDEIAEKFVKCFEEVYGKRFVDIKDCVEDNGYVMVPAFVRTSAGKRYLALLDIDVSSSGEHWGTQVLFKKYYVVNQDNFEKVLSKKDFKTIFPYKYRPLITVVGDIHTDCYF